MELMGIPIIDVLIIGIILLGVLEGLFRGFIVVTLSFLSYIIALVVAKLYYPVLSGFIMNSTDLFGDIRKALERWVNDLAQVNGVDQVVHQMQLPEGIKETAANQIQAGVNVQASNVSGSVVELFFNIVSIILIFIAVKFLIFIIMKLLDSVAQIPILKELNRIAGLFAGGIKGILLVYVVFLLMTPVITFAPDGQLANAVLSSNLGPIFYYNNIIWKLFNSIGKSVIVI